MTDKQIIVSWQEHSKPLIECTAINIDEPEEVCAKRRIQLEAMPEEWFKYYFSRYVYAEPARFHIEASKRILANPEWYEVRLWSRELAKTTRTMLEILFLCLTGKKKYVILISNSLDNAARLLMPYKLNLEQNSKVIQDYGNQESAGKWTITEFTTEKGVSFRALGAGQSPRGTRNEEVRPDIILFDDLDTDADCLNAEIIAKKWRWVEEAAISTRSVSMPTTILFCGNKIALNCCIERACLHADYIDKVNIRDAFGLSSWPQKNTEEHIDRVIKQKSYASVQKEYFNNPITEGSVFKTIAYKPAYAINEYSYLVCYTDPSYTATGDYKATVLVGIYNADKSKIKTKDNVLNWEYHIIKCFLDQTTTASMIDWHLQILSLVSDCKCSYFMESVFMQKELVKELHNAVGAKGRYIPLEEDKRVKANKFVRIETMLEPLNRNGKLYLNENEKSNLNMKRLEEQFLAFGPGSSAHDDGPDAVDGAIWKLNERYMPNYFKDIFYFNKEKN